MTNRTGKKGEVARVRSLYGYNDPKSKDLLWWKRYAQSLEDAIVTLETEAAYNDLHHAKIKRLAESIVGLIV